MYITYKLKSSHHTIPLPQSLNFSNLYNNSLPTSINTYSTAASEKYFTTFTKHIEAPFTTYQQFCEHYRRTLNVSDLRFDALLFDIEDLARMSPALVALPRSETYHSFLIPKRSGGMRQINAPIDAMKIAQNEFKWFLENSFILTHNAAHAYVKGRCTKTALEVHQRFESKYFLKLDIKDFFQNHTKEYILRQFASVYPLNGFMLDEQHNACFQEILNFCMYDGGLPQGSPASPIITNICMVPIDYELTKLCGKHFRYTRYADDILISSKHKFNFQDMQDKVQAILNSTPFQLKTEKTRYGSSGGRNWNLGLMLNKENQITLGHKRKESFKIALHHFISENKDEITWSREYTQIFQGQLSYFHSIEPVYTTELLQKYSQKYNVNIKNLIKSILR